MRRARRFLLAIVPWAAIIVAPRLANAQRTASDRWTDSVLATLSLRDRAAQMVWPNLIGDYVATDAPQWKRLRDAIEIDHVGGLLISVGSPIEIAAKLNALQGMSRLPLLVGADLETGAGMRARGGFFVPNGIDLGGATLFPTNMALGAANDTALAYAEGRITAREGRAIGVHIDFAPVLDVNNNPNNPVINVRSYGEDPHEVAQLGAAFIRGLQDNGMIATAKHFPGHGDTDVNSHLALPVVTATRARLDSVELVPFRAAIAAHVGAFMTFHGAMPALDSSNTPGTLSPKINIDLLRTQLGFSGLIVSDAMDMRGVLDRYGPIESVKRAVAAGVDVLIQAPDARAAIDAIVAGVAEGRYPEARITASARRILALKYRVGLHRSHTVNLDTLRQVVGDSTSYAVARTIADRSITVLRDSLRLLPLTASPTTRILSITVARRADLSAGTTLDAELRRTFPLLRSAFVSADDSTVAYARLDAAADSADITIISSYVGQVWNAVTANAPEAFTNWVTALTKPGLSRRKVIVIAFGNPYMLQQMPAVPEYVIAWSGAPVSQLAAARALAGTIAITGQLPITIPPLASRKAGLTFTPDRRISPSNAAAPNRP